MRLINTHTRQFEEFISRSVPKYAILSHTWGDDEVSFKDMNGPAHQVQGKEGYKKIDQTCRIAARAGISYAWVDACCIDKESSAELTEAINSMYNWYLRSEICYAYLVDFPTSGLVETGLRDCRWFSRGWTLQELIAPNSISFFDQEWNYRGSKADLIDQLTAITGVDRDILQHNRTLSSISVAQKMSWAADRETTRIEDMAYSLLGIFEVHMPLLYGEEERAFRRLQEEIIKSVADLSIFAWSRAPPDVTVAPQAPGHREYCGFLAESPAFFHGCGTVTKVAPYRRQELWASNGGIMTRMQLLIELIPETGAYRYILPLDCCQDPKVTPGVRIRKCGPNEFVRENPWKVEEFRKPLFSSNTHWNRYLISHVPEQIKTPDCPIPNANTFIGNKRARALQIKLPPEMWHHPYDIWPGERFDGEDQAFFLPEVSPYDSGILRLRGALKPRPPGVWSTDIAFECMFFGVGWASTDAGSLQCTVLNYGPHAAAIAEFKSNISGWDYHRDPYLEELVHERIPKSSSTVIQIPGTQTSIRVSFETMQVEERSICRNKFWRVEFSCQVYQEETPPEVIYEEWTLRKPGSDSTTEAAAPQHLDTKS